MSETTLKTSAVERFLRYVTFDTQSDENSTTYPSTTLPRYTPATRSGQCELVLADSVGVS